MYQITFIISIITGSYNVYILKKFSETLKALNEIEVEVKLLKVDEGG